MTYPTRQQAQELWQQTVDQRESTHQERFKKEYIAHTSNVAKCAEVVAAKCGMDKDKAYVLGLLHDFGKRQKEQETGVFHAQDGYDEMMRLGYDEVARVCLTHTFIKNPIDRDNFNHKKEWLDWADDLLKDIEYDDYDKLIQMCDLFAEALSVVSIEARFEGVAKRYGLTQEQKSIATEKALQLKQYFDAKCSCNIYDLLGIEQ